jgi:hypothetical protein
LSSEALGAKEDGSVKAAATVGRPASDEFRIGRSKTIRRSAKAGVCDL